MIIVIGILIAVSIHENHTQNAWQLLGDERSELRLCALREASPPAVLPLKGIYGGSTGFRVRASQNSKYHFEVPIMRMIVYRGLY